MPKAQEKHFMMAQSDFFHGFGGPQHAKKAKNACFWAKNNIQNVIWGYACMEIFYFGNSISSLFGAPICQILNFGRPHGTQQHYFAEKRPLKKSTPATKKWRLKVGNFVLLRNASYCTASLLRIASYCLVMVTYQYIYIINILTLPIHYGNVTTLPI